VFDEWVRQKASRKENELGDLLHAFRGSCLRSLPEMIDEVKNWGSRALSQGEVGSGGGIADMTRNVCPPYCSFVIFRKHPDNENR